MTSPASLVYRMLPRIVQSGQGSTDSLFIELFQFRLSSTPGQLGYQASWDTRPVGERVEPFVRHDGCLATAWIALSVVFLVV